MLGESLSALSTMDHAIRRTLIRLGAAYALAWASTSMVAGPGSAALVRLTGNLNYAGLFVGIVYIGGAIGAAFGGRAMDRFGRRPPLIAAYILAAASFIVAGMGLALHSAFMFVAGVMTAAASFGTANLTRVAAADLFPPSERGRGVSWVQISAIFGAVTGPLLLILSEPLGRAIGREPLTLVWFLAPPLLIASAILAALAQEPRQLAATIVGTDAETGATVNTRGTPRGVLTAGMVSLAASQAAMATVMGVAGAAVSHAGHGVSVLGALMFAHFVGMFGLSRVVGGIADRLGRRRTILIGLTLLALGGAVVATIRSPAGFGAGLMLVGLGWSFGYIGGTVLLSDVTTVSTRARTLGRADLAAQLTACVIALAGGWWFAAHGIAGLGLAAIAVVILPIVLMSLVREQTPGRYVLQSAS